FVAQMTFQLLQRHGRLDAGGEHLPPPVRDGFFEVKHIAPFVCLRLIRFVQPCLPDHRPCMPAPWQTRPARLMRGSCSPPIRTAQAATWPKAARLAQKKLRLKKPLAPTDSEGWQADCASAANCQHITPARFSRRVRVDWFRSSPASPDSPIA